MHKNNNAIPNLPKGINCFHSLPSGKGCKISCCNGFITVKYI